MSQRVIYQDALPYFITTVVHGRKAEFVREDRAKIMANIIRQGCEMKRFHLMGFAIIPDHVHFLVLKMRVHDENATARPFQPARSNPSMVARSNPTQPARLNSSEAVPNISNLVQCIKGFYSRQVHEGKFWQSRYYSRIIDTDEYLANVISYLQGNYLKHELDDKYSQWPYLWLAPNIGHQIENVV